MISSETYVWWALKRLAKRTLGYFVVAPLLLVLWPVMTIGNGLYRLFQICQEQ